MRRVLFKPASAAELANRPKDKYPGYTVDIYLKPRMACESIKFNIIITPIGATFEKVIEVVVK